MIIYRNNRNMNMFKEEIVVSIIVIKKGSYMVVDGVCIEFLHSRFYVVGLLKEWLVGLGLGKLP